MLVGMEKNEVLITEKHSLKSRWFHWINVPLLSLMVWSGWLIYWADQAWIEIPDSLSESLHLHHRLAEGMGWHFFIMWPYAINGLLYLLYLTFSGEWRELMPVKSNFKDALIVIAHDLKLRKDPPPQFEKYNAAQKLAYAMAIVMGIGTLFTGLAIYKPVQMGWLTSLLGGYRLARLEHFLLMIGFVIFFFIHIIQVIRAGWNNFRSMVAGYEIEK